MLPLRTIKELTHEAIDLMEASFHQTGHQASRSQLRACLGLPTRYEIQIGEIKRLCTVENKTRAMLLANITTHLAVSNAESTLLVTTRSSPCVCAVSLLFWLAGIGLEEALDPKWGEEEFGRLTYAACALASARLFIALPTNSDELRCAVKRSVELRGIRRVVVDNPPYTALSTFADISRELDVGITVVGDSFEVCRHGRSSR